MKNVIRTQQHISDTFWANQARHVRGEWERIMLIISMLMVSIRKVRHIVLKKVCNLVLDRCTMGLALDRDHVLGYVGTDFTGVCMTNL